MNIIEIKNLKKNFGETKALKDVTFNVKKGDVIGFIGPNGAGKTTTIRIILGLIKKTSGNITVFGENPWNNNKIRESISYVPGDLSLWDNLTGGEIIDIFMKLHGSGNEKKKDELIKKFNFDKDKKSKTYSKGNRQKVSLISALSTSSELYIFDEPTTGLDPLMETVFQKEIEKLKKEGKTIILSSHILSEVEKIVDKIIIIKNGIIAEAGNLNDFRHLTRSTVIINGDIKKDLLKDFDNLKIGKNISFSIDNKDINKTLLVLSKLNINKIEIKPPSLEEMFMRHYND